MSKDADRHDEFQWWWTTVPLSWIKAEGMSARRRIAGITAIAPGEVRKPFTYRANPYPFFYRPGKRARREAEPAQQAFLRDATEDFQEHFDRACRSGERSRELISVPAPMVYSTRIRDQKKAVLVCLYSFRMEDGAGEYMAGGWHNRRLLMNRVCSAYKRRYVDGSHELQCDSGTIDELLVSLQEDGLIRCQEVERDGRRGIAFVLAKDLEERLGPMPLMPSARKVRPWVRRWEQAFESHLEDPAEPPFEGDELSKNLPHRR